MFYDSRDVRKEHQHLRHSIEIKETFSKCAESVKKGENTNVYPVQNQYIASSDIPSFSIHKASSGLLRQPRPQKRNNFVNEALPESS
jgi:hypothetical protein